MAVTAPFSFDAYANLLNSVTTAGYEILTVRDYLGSDSLPDNFVVLRHDVDRKPQNAEKMATLEADLGLSSTYYFRTSTFDPDRLDEIAALGHEVGYHYEDFVKANGNVQRAHERFLRNLEYFRQVEQIDTVCMHGNPLSPYDNREMWTAKGAPSFDAYDLLGEAYLSMDFTDVTYFSDTGRTWQDGPLKIKDHTMGEGDKSISVAETKELANLFETDTIDRACLLAHPERWADSPMELVTARAKDRTVNLVKRGMHIIS